MGFDKPAKHPSFKIQGLAETFKLARFISPIVLLRSIKNLARYFALTGAKAKLRNLNIFLAFVKCNFAPDKSENFWLVKWLENDRSQLAKCRNWRRNISFCINLIGALTHV